MMSKSRTLPGSPGSRRGQYDRRPPGAGGVWRRRGRAGSLESCGTPFLGRTAATPYAAERGPWGCAVSGRLPGQERTGARRDSHGKQ